MASAGGAGYTALASLGEGIRLLAKSLAKTWGADGITDVVTYVIANGGANGVTDEGINADRSTNYLLLNTSNAADE